MATGDIPPDTNMHTVHIEKEVAIIPLSLDLVSRVILDVPKRCWL
jgi:hypothetical protein